MAANAFIEYSTDDAGLTGPRLVQAVDEGLEVQVVKDVHFAAAGLLLGAVLVLWQMHS